MSLPADIVVIALGSNLGDPVRNVLAAMSALERFSDLPVQRSALWQSEPVDCPPGSPLFVNAVAAFWPRPGETPLTLLEKTQQLERELGRAPKQVMNEARMVDVDLIAFGRLEIQTPELCLPHPRAAQRRFVLEPLAELDPDYVLPGQGLTAGRLLAGLSNPEIVRRLGESSPG